MEKVISVLLILISFQAHSSETKELMKRVCLHSSGCELYQGEQSSAQSLILAYAKYVDQSPLEDGQFKEAVSNLPRIGETHWGLFEKTMAMDFIRSHQEISFRAGPKKEDLRRIMELLSGESHLKFGFSASTGGSLCGVNFPGLLIIDTEKSLLYDLSLFGWPSC